MVFYKVRIEQDFGLIPERYVYAFGPDGASAAGAAATGPVADPVVSSSTPSPA